MLKVNEICTVDDRWIAAVLRNMRNSWESWEKSTPQADRDLAQRLQKAGDSHGKWARQIPLFIEVQSTESFWRQFDTYTVGVAPPGDLPANSTSIMHVAGRRAFTANDFAPTAEPAIIAMLNEWRDQWIAAGRKRGDVHWKRIVDNRPPAWLYTRGVTMNYMVARHIATDRRNHRLDEWATLIDAFRTLPYAGEFIFAGLL